MTKIFDETLDAIQSNGKTPNDVWWVGSHDGRYVISWDVFERQFSDVEYDSGYGGQEIASDLVVVGDNWWLSRSEYDGSECWRFETRPKVGTDTQTFSRITDPDGACWASIEEMNRPGGKYADLPTEKAVEGL